MVFGPEIGNCNSGELVAMFRHIVCIKCNL